MLGFCFSLLEGFGFRAGSQRSSLGGERGAEHRAGAPGPAEAALD